MSLLDAKPIYKPFNYPWAYDAWLMQQKIHWLPEEVSLSEDVRDWKTKLSPAETNLLTQLFRFFTQSDLEVSNCYHQHYLSVFQPTEVRMMLLSFANMETVHLAAYSHLLDTVGMPEIEYQAFLQHKEMKDKYDYMHGFNVNDPFNIAVTLAAFGAFTEGLQLFSSFAIMLNFPRHNKMKGMGQIITWSVRDECYSDDTEILTSKGWKLFSSLQEGDEVAQYNPESEAIDFIEPRRIVNYEVDANLVEYNHRNVNFKVTPHHRTLICKNGKPVVVEAQDLTPHPRHRIPVSGRAKGTTVLTVLDKLFIALQADGYIPKGANRTGEKCGYRRCSFSLTKSRKKDRIRLLLAEAGLAFWEKELQAGEVVFHVDFPLNATKNFKDWINLKEVSSEWADSFMQELVHWDGNVKSKDTMYYSTTDSENMDYVQAIAVLGGWSTSRGLQVDNRKETYKDVHRLTFKKQYTVALGHSKTKQDVPYKGKVWCVEVETGFLVVRRNNKVCISGNSLHCESIVKLFHTFVQENPSIDKVMLNKRLLQICQEIVMLEDNFIDLAFEQGGVEGLEPSEVKSYIRYIANRRLTQLGMDEIYSDKKNPLPWLDMMLNGAEHTNFFENRVTEYTKAGTTGDWDEVF